MVSYINQFGLIMAHYRPDKALMSLVEKTMDKYPKIESTSLIFFVPVQAKGTMIFCLAIYAIFLLQFYFFVLCSGIISGVYEMLQFIFTNWIYLISTFALSCAVAGLRKRNHFLLIPFFLDSASGIPRSVYSYTRQFYPKYVEELNYPKQFCKSILKGNIGFKVMLFLLILWLCFLAADSTFRTIFAYYYEKKAAKNKTITSTSAPNINFN